jgi:hypothetical protein
VSRPPRRLGRTLAQAAIALIGVGLLVWAVMLALSTENREKLAALRHAPAGAIALLLALSLATQALNGLIFWVMLLPVRRLRAADVLATNAICTMLAYVPAKTGAIVRVLIHNRRDRVPLLTIGAWFAAIALVMAVAFTPPVLASLALKRLDAAWVAATLAGEAVLAGALVLAARAFRGDRGVRRLAAVVRALRLHAVDRILRSRLWANLHTGFDMLAHPGTVGATLGLRLADVAIQALRFLLAARILEIALPIHAAIVIALAYFVIGIVAPFMVGLREMGVIGLAAAMLPAVGHDNAAFAPVPLLVTATESLVFLAAAAAGLAWLRPHRVLGLKAAPDPPGAPDRAASAPAAPAQPKRT